MHRTTAMTLAPRLAALLLVCAAGCQSDPAAPAAVPSSTPAAAASAAPVAKAAAASSAPEVAAGKPTRQIVGASHVLVTYKGAEGASKGVTRSKDDAKKRAEEAAKKIQEGLSFEDAVKKYSDDEGSTPVNGAVGNFERAAMPPAFSDATFAMKVGDISIVVETPRGFHIIKRTL